MSNIGWNELQQNGANPEAAVNEALNKLDKALTETLPVDLSAGNANLSIAQVQSAIVFSLNGAAQARDLTLPQIKRLIFFRNTGTAIVTLKRGTTSLPLAPGNGGSFVLDGTENGLRAITGSGSTVPENRMLPDPETGATGQVPKLTADKTVVWADDVVGSGGGGGSESLLGNGYTGERAAVITPVIADFEALANGTATTLKDIAGKGISIFNQTKRGTGAAFFARIGKSLPTTGNFSVTTAFSAALFGHQYPSVGCQFRRTSTDRRMTCEMLNVDSTPKVEFNIWNSDSAYNKALLSAFKYHMPPHIWFRMEWIEGSGAQAYFSADGIEWVKTVTNNNDITRPDKADIFIKMDGGPTASNFLYVKALFYHFAIAAL